MKTIERIMEVVSEANKAGKMPSICYIGEETAVVVVQNPEQVTPRGPDMVPGFYVAKYYKGELVSEHFI